MTKLKKKTILVTKADINSALDLKIGAENLQWASVTKGGIRIGILVTAIKALQSQLDTLHVTMQTEYVALLSH